MTTLSHPHPCGAALSRGGGRRWRGGGFTQQGFDVGAAKEQTIVPLMAGSLRKGCELVSFDAPVQRHSRNIEQFANFLSSHRVRRFFGISSHGLHSKKIIEKLQVLPL